MNKINLKKSKSNQIALVRIGYIGDLITAVQFSRNYNFDLVAYESKTDLLFQKKNSEQYENILTVLGLKLNFKILICRSGLSCKKTNNAKAHKKSFLVALIPNLSSYNPIKNIADEITKKEIKFRLELIRLVSKKLTSGNIIFINPTTHRLKKIIAPPNTATF